MALKHYIRTISALGAACLLFVAAGCSTAPTPVASGPRAPAAVKPAKPDGSPRVEDRLRSEIRSWVGTPHRLGGNTRKGVDCSGFVKRIYNDVFNIRLPRTTASQVRVGTAVDKKHLRTGDLVFFHPPYKIRHVGIYLGDGRFAHASAKRGVMVSDLGESYWRQSYWTARRIIYPDS